MIAAIVLAAWATVKTEGGVTVEARPVDGSPYAELRATTTVALPVEALCAGAFGTGKRDPAEPSLKSRKVISETADARVAYDQIATPVIKDRDYTVRTRRERPSPTTCRVVVEPANALGPAPSDAFIRIEKVRCVWDFEPEADGKTKVTYVAWTDPETSMPAFLVEPSRRDLMVTWMNLVIARATASTSAR